MAIGIDPFSATAIPLRLLFGDTPLSAATGFVWGHGGSYYLVTNWHNVTGKDPNTGKHLSRTAAEPNRVLAFFSGKGDLRTRPVIYISLFDESGDPLWLVHPDAGQQVDVVALPIPETIANEVDLHPINDLPTEVLDICVGMEVFVIGFPLGPKLALTPPFSPALLFFPVWKRGSIASEPQMLVGPQRHILVDTASRSGMSGSPVILRQRLSVVEGGGIATIDTRPKTRLIGVYSGRIGQSDSLDAQLGICWPVELLEQIIAAGKRDSI